MIFDKILIGAAAAGILLAGVQTIRLSNAEADHSRTVAAYREREAQAAAIALARQNASIAESDRRTQEKEKAIRDAENLANQARAERDALAASAQRLRNQIARSTAAARGCPADNPSTAGTGQAADASVDLLADVQKRLDDAADSIAEFADASRIAGSACERIYDSLTQGSPTK